MVILHIRSIDDTKQSRISSFILVLTGFLTQRLRVEHGLTALLF